MRWGIWKAMVWATAMCSAAVCVSAQQNAPVTAMPTKEGDFVAVSYTHLTLPTIYSV